MALIALYVEPLIGQRGFGAFRPTKKTAVTIMHTTRTANCSSKKRGAREHSSVLVVVMSAPAFNFELTPTDRYSHSAYTVASPTIYVPW